MKSPGCDKCRHPLFAGIKCGVCGWEAGQLHTCSYSCTRPACVLAQRDELRAKLEEYEAAATFFANLQQADEALMRQALEALEGKRHTACGWRSDCDKAITVLRKRLEGKK